MNIEDFWDNAASRYKYNQWEKSIVAEYDYASTKEILLEFLEPNKTDYILEIGCGPGKWTNIISDKCKNIIGIDISGNMISEAKKTCKKSNTKFIHTDFMRAEVCGGFDKIFAVRSFGYIHDKEKFISKANILLKPGGKLVIITKSTPCLWDITKKVKGFHQTK